MIRYSMLILTLFTLVLYEPTTATDEIEVYNYGEGFKIEVICPEGVTDSDCKEPVEEIPRDTETISLEDIQNCAKNDYYFF